MLLRIPVLLACLWHAWPGTRDPHRARETYGAYPKTLLIGVPAPRHGPAQPVESATLQNVFQVEDGLYSGSAPETEAAFAELSRLGIKTIVSVDGSKPHVELAHKFGMRYVHLPIGYDGVPQQRSAEFVKALQGATGAVYFHCHHGLHRGPAAAAATCIAAKGWTAAKAEEFLHQAGTAPDYAGLFRDVRAYRPPNAAELEKVSVQLPEIAKTPAFVDTMVSIDEQFDAIKKTTPGQRPPQELAILLREQFRELQRDPALENRGLDFQRKLAAAEQAAEALHLKSTDPAAVKAMSEACTACHKTHRN